MPPALVTNTAIRSANGTTAVTSAITTTTATLLVVVVTDFSGGATTLTDSKTNTWIPRTSKTASDTESQIYYAVNPTVGTGHTFTVTSGGSGTAPALAVFALSGMHTVSPFDVESAGDGAAGVTFITAGSLTPSAANEVVIAGVCIGAVGPTVSSIDSSFTLLHNLTATGTAYGVGTAYQIQTTATARTPVFSFSAATACAAVMAAFKEAGAAPSGQLRPFMMQHSA